MEHGSIKSQEIRRDCGYSYEDHRRTLSVKETLELGDVPEHCRKKSIRYGFISNLNIRWYRRLEPSEVCAVAGLEHTMPGRDWA